MRVNSAGHRNHDKAVRKPDLSSFRLLTQNCFYFPPTNHKHLIRLFSRGEICHQMSMLGQFEPKAGGLLLDAPGGKASMQSRTVLGRVGAPSKDKAAYPEEGGDGERSQAGVVVRHHGVTSAPPHSFHMSVAPGWIHHDHIHLPWHFLFKFRHIAGGKRAAWRQQQHSSSQSIDPSIFSLLWKLQTT